MHSTVDYCHAHKDDKLALSLTRPLAKEISSKVLIKADSDDPGILVRKVSHILNTS